MQRNRDVSQRIAAMQRLAPMRGERLLHVGGHSREYSRVLANNFDSVDTVLTTNVLAFAPNTFDRIVMIDALKYLTNTEGVFKQLQRVLTPRGRIIVTTPSSRWPLATLGNINRHDVRDIARFTKPAALEIENYTYLMPALDSLEEGHVLHRATHAIERVADQFFGQTVIASLRHR